jgi:Zn-dependent protease
MGLQGLAPLEAFTYFLALLVSVTVHEYGHALAAIFEGDLTPTKNGKFIWNPLYYLNWIGFIMFLLIGFGFLGQVRTRPELYRHGLAGEALVSSAGILMNLSLVLVATLALRLLDVHVVGNSLIGGGTTPTWIIDGLLTLFRLNVVLAVFNLLPIPPLDGAHFLAAIIPGSMGASLRHFLPQSGYLAFFVLILLQQPVGQFLGLVLDFAYTNLLK